MQDLIRKELYKKIFFNSITDSRYKTNKISVNFVTPLNKDSAAKNALIPNILRKGYDECPEFTELNKKLEELYGAYLDYGVEKYGDVQVISLSVSSIDDSYAFDNEALTEKMSDLICDLLLRPVFENGEFLESEIRIEKEILINTIKAEINEKRSYALGKANSLMCEGEPHGISKLGEVEDVEQITAKSLTTQYKNFIESSAIEIMFIGCGNPEKSLEIFKERLECVSDKEKTPAMTKHHKPLDGVIEETEHMQVSQSKMVLGFAVTETLSKEEVFALMVMSAVFGGTPMSKLFMNIREKMSLCYYCVSRFDKTKMIMRVDCGVENENIVKAKEAILDQLEQVKQGQVSDEELKNALMSLTNSFNTVRDHVSALEGFYLSQIIRGEAVSPEQMTEYLNKVSKEDVIDVASKLKLDISYVLTSESGKE